MRMEQTEPVLPISYRRSRLQRVTASGSRPALRTDQRRGTAGIGNHHRRSLRQLTGRSPDADAVLVGQRDGAFADRAGGAVFGVADAIGLW